MKSLINVAIAILHFGEKYLLGYRNASQHQGEKYEFIGGKIEANETPKQGLIREVFEEISCDISANLAIKMGIIRHTYVEKDKPEKSVALHCFKIELTQSQFDGLQSGIGTEGQAITWVEKADLLAKKYPLPEANARILDWLKLLDVIFISQSLASFENEKDWVDFYVKKLPENAVFYCRLQADLEQSFSAITELLTQRSDILPLVQFKIWQNNSQQFENRNFIVHLNHAELMTLDVTNLSKNQRYFVSSHDSNSLSKINQLAETHNVMGCFLSPVLPTPTHPESEGMGWDKFAQLAEMCDVPVFGLGGLGQNDLGKVWQNNGFGVAGIRLIEGF